jgi:hypothetical protein
MEGVGVLEYRSAGVLGLKAEIDLIIIPFCSSTSWVQFWIFEFGFKEFCLS